MIVIWIVLNDRSILTVNQIANIGIVTESFLMLVSKTIIIVLLFVYGVVVVGQTFRSISSQAGLQLSECFFSYAIFSTFYFETDHRKCEMTLGG